MSATAPARATRANRRPIVTGLPSIQVVPSPAPVRGFVATIVTCALLLCGALAAVFALNTAMVEGAYQIQQKQILLNDLADSREALSDEISAASTTTQLRASAEDLGLEPATEVRHIDLGAGVVTGGASPEGQ